MTTMALALAFEDTSNLPAEILAGLSVLKNTDPELFIKAKSGMLTFDETRPKLALDTEPVDSALTYVTEFGSDIWMYFLGVETTDERLKSRYEDFGRYFRRGSAGLLSWVANSVIDRLQPMK